MRDQHVGLVLGYRKAWGTAPGGPLSAALGYSARMRGQSWRHRWQTVDGLENGKAGLKERSLQGVGRRLGQTLPSAVVWGERYCYCNKPAWRGKRARSWQPQFSPAKTRRPVIDAQHMQLLPDGGAAEIGTADFGISLANLAWPATDFR